MNIKDAVQTLSKKDIEHYSLVCEVLSVDKSNYTCDVMPVNSEAEIFDVKLCVDSKGKLSVQYPKVGSFVTVSFLDKNNAFVSSFSIIDLYTIQTENESLKKILSDILDGIVQLTVTTGMGASGTPINATVFTMIKQRLDMLLDE